MKLITFYLTQYVKMLHSEHVINIQITELRVIFCLYSVRMYFKLRVHLNSSQSHFKCSVATFRQWLLYRTVQVQSRIVDSWFSNYCSPFPGGPEDLSRLFFAHVKGAVKPAYNSSASLHSRSQACSFLSVNLIGPKVAPVQHIFYICAQ